MDLFRFQVKQILSDNINFELNIKVSAIHQNISNDSNLYSVLLKGFWFDCRVKIDDIVHVIQARYNDETKTFYINNEQGLLIVNPDLLIPSTTLMSSNYCMRKAWLTEQFKCYGFGGNKVMLIGDVVHQLFQSACQTKAKERKTLKELLSNILQDIYIMNCCYAIGLTENQLLKEVEMYLPHIELWLSNYIHSSRKPLNPLELDCDLSINSIKDIEDNIWNTKLGLKGKVDLTVEATIRNEQMQNKILPLELKTGRPTFSSEHEGQVAIYSIMMEEQYHTKEGLLLYLKDGPQMKTVQVKHSVKRDLIQLRNKLNLYLQNNQNGPPPKNIHQICSKCDRLLECTLFLKTIDPNHLSNADVMSKDLVPRMTNHLTQAHLDYFKKWISLLHLEISSMNELSKKINHDFWNESPETREEKNVGFAKMILKNRFDEGKCCVFVRSHDFIESLGSLKCNQSLIKVWERVALSIEPQSNDCYAPSRVALTIGLVKSINENQIELVLENQLDIIYSSCIFRIDHLSSNTWFNINFSNLLRLMDPECDHAKYLREMIIDKKPAAHKNKFTKKIVTKGKDILKSLSMNQQKMLLKSISTDSYYVLKDVDKNEKMQIIVTLIRLLSTLNQTVLLTSNSHSSLDNILLELITYKIDFLRIGKVNRINKNVHDYADQNRTANIKNLNELEEFYDKRKIVATTCNGVTSHPIFERKMFHFCIIDEASQILIPTILGPMFNAKRFIIIGDPKQLTPVIRSQSAKLIGIHTSLIEELFL